MSTGNKKQEQGTEKVPTLLDQAETASSADVVLLEEKVAALESAVSVKDATIEELKGGLKTKEEELNSKDAKIQELEKDKEGLVNELKEEKNIVAQLDALLKSEAPKQQPGENEVLIRFTLSPAGKFKLPYNVGQEVALHEEVAAEIVEAKYAEYVK
ncbi:hypothetical protein [Myroides odoratus]|uniref:Membrane-bound metallopeptidase n=1 Tax=Myroides odoratus TaxID=256 RepID=A0A378RPE4_MYROD|nr:hypothetical protein [Myroides odoratus]QQU04026.1 hypothetical protein I6I89_01650 [Myroides odoratus]STZ28588.1 Uncharacterised protein [Myroides odoratus]